MIEKQELGTYIRSDVDRKDPYRHRDMKKGQEHRMIKLLRVRWRSMVVIHCKGKRWMKEGMLVL